jgi:hypothetical protein
MSAPYPGLPPAATVAQSLIFAQLILLRDLNRKRQVTP